VLEAYTPKKLEERNMKKCNTCGEWKDEEEFHNQKNSKDGKSNICKICRRKKNREYSKSYRERHPKEYDSEYWHDYRQKNKERLKEQRAPKKEEFRWYHIGRKYGITKGEYDKLYVDQNGCCAICGKWFDILVIDHDHEKNMVRGLLCKNCNPGIGHFFDNINILEKAIKYIKKFDGESYE
jgi:hypothetical protein